MLGVRTAPLTLNVSALMGINGNSAERESLRFAQWLAGLGISPLPKPGDGHAELDAASFPLYNRKEIALDVRLHLRARLPMVWYADRK